MGLLADYLPSLPTDPGQNDAARQGLLAFGAAMLGGRGNFGSIMGQGLAAGAGGYNSALQALQQKALVDAQTKHYTLANEAEQAKLDEPGQIAAILGPQAGAAAPSPSAPVALVTGGAPLSNLPQMSPAADRPLSMVPQASSAPQAPAMPAAAPKPATQADRAGLFDQYIGMADKLAQAGKMAYAKQYYDLAEKLKPEVLKTEDLIDRVTGEPVHVMTFKDGSTKVAPFGSMPDYQVVNNGKSNDLIDKRTGKKGASYAISVSPDAEYSRQTQYGVQGMIDAREKAAAKEVKPPAGYRWTASGDLEAIPGGPAQGAGKLSEDQAKASGWVVQAENAWKNVQSVAFDKNGNLTAAARPGFADAVAAVPGLGGVGNSRRTPERQKFIQAVSSMSEAFLRAATGAGVNKEEAEQKIAELTPVWGEDPETTKQKMDSIPLYLESLRMRAGPGAAKAAEVLDKAEVAKDREKVKPISGLPKKPKADAGLPSDIAALVAKHGRK